MFDKRLSQFFQCIVELEGVESEDDAPDTAYYQWVTFFMAIQVLEYKP